MIKDTYKYHVKIGQKVIDRGFCLNLIEKENEYKIKYPGCHLDQIGRICSYRSAIKWLHDGGKRSYNWRIG